VQLSSHRHLNIFSPPKRAVEITIGGEILESEPRFSLFGTRGKTLQQLRQEIIHYANDAKVEALLITFETPEYGFAQAQQIRRSLEEFKLTGKELIAYAESYTQKSYYVASVCDEVYLMPTGYLDLKGLAFVMGYWKKTLDKLGIEVQVARAKDYKTAANMLTHEDTSEPEAEMLNWLLDDIYDQLCLRIGEGRGWTLDEVKEKIDAGAYNSRRAVDEGLVDELIYYDQIVHRLENEEFSPISEKRYWQSPEYVEDWPDTRIPRVAVIYAEGPIFSGESQGDFFGTDYMGSKTISEAIRQARENRSIDAIILRVDSPGGSATASDVIYREVRRTVTDKKHRKPIIVSMGNVAGSGGYYIACGADTIVAEEGTITGSIGVLGGKVSLAGLYEKIYYNTHTFKRGEHADAWRTTRPFSEEEMEMLQETIDQFYDDFLERISESRGMSKAELDKVAEGRVWTGSQAVEKGLIDMIGGMDVAMSVVRGSLGIDETVPLKLDFYPKPKPFFAGMFSDVMTSRTSTLPDVLYEAAEPLALMLEFYDGEPLMLMQHRVEIE
jgi:protease-4